MYKENSYKISYRTEIDGLRALAVLCVVIFHFFPNLLGGGYLGVDIFFVISGFLITSQLINHEQESIKTALLSFYKRRIKRLFPALFLFLTLTYLFVSFLFMPSDLEAFEDSLLASYSFWANFFFWRDGGYFGGNDQLKPLLHIWSLSVEEQFYLFSPLTILLLTNLSRRIRYSFVLGLLGLVAASFFLWKYLNIIGGQNPAFFLLPTRIWQFGMGALLAAAYRDNLYLDVNKTIKSAFFILSVALLSFGILANVDFEIQTVLVTLGAVGFIAFSFNHSSFLTNFFRSKLAVFFGQISYSLYLYHWPIASALTYYFVDKISPAYSFIGLSASIFLGWLSYILIENRFRNAFNLMVTLSFLFLCMMISGLLFFLNTKNETVSLANTLSKASGTHYRCDIFSYRPYGSSRSCLVSKVDLEDKTIALIGNSHAQMYAPLLAEVGADNFNSILVPLNACLPTTSINISSECIQLATRNLSTVLNDKSISFVIIATTWDSSRYIDGNGVIVGPRDLKLAIEDLITQIKTSGKHPILFSPIPTPKKDYASDLARKLWFGHISEQEVYNIIKVSRSQFDDEFSGLNRYFVELLGNSYVKIYDELCDQSYCIYGNDELFYFADRTHLSQNAFVRFNKTKKKLKSILIFNN